MKLVAAAKTSSLIGSRLANMYFWDEETEQVYEVYYCINFRVG
ncbi:hypothetical protein [Spirosoma horti]